VRWRYVPPVYSPLSAQAIGAGVRAALFGDRGARERLAKALGEFHGVTRVVLTDSGTTALRLAMQAAMEQSGRRHVALPAYCCYDLVTALNGAGAGVVLYDVDPDTLGPSWPSLEQALASRPAAVVAAHLYGLPVDMPRVMELADVEGVTVIEDNAQGIGATLHGRPLGTFGHLRILSFGRGKGVTGGKGGALLVGPGWRGPVPGDGLPSSRGVKELAALLAQWVLARPSLYRIPASIPALGLGETVYREPSRPRGISEVAAAVAEVSWRTRLPEIEHRRAAASSLLAMAREAGWNPVRPVPGANPGWLRVPVTVANPGPRWRSARRGVMPGYPRSLVDLPQLPPPVESPPAPGARALASKLVTLPTHRFVNVATLAGLAGLAGDR